MAKRRIGITRYFNEEGFIDRARADVFAELSQLKGEDVKSWLYPILERDNQGENGQREFYGALAELLGGIPISERLKSRQYNGIKWSVNEAIKLSGIGEGSKVLDIGCGTGLESALFGEIVGSNGEVVGIDMAEKALEAARGRAKRRNLGNTKFLAASRDKIPFPDNYFDNAFCFCSFTEGENEDIGYQGDFVNMHMGSLRAKEIGRVLKNGGKVCIVEPSDKDMNEYIELRAGGMIKSGGLAIRDVKIRNFLAGSRRYPYSDVLFLAEKEALSQ